MVMFDDPVTVARIGGTALIIGGVVLLNVGGAVAH
jgi:multidrug transporter EmrE-like cation transporter